MTLKKRLFVIGENSVSSNETVIRMPNTSDTQALPEDFGRNLDSVEKARTWLTNPHNWLESSFYVLKWDGVLCKVARKHGERLIREPHDNGLPLVVVAEQMRIRRGGSRDIEVATE